MKVERAKRVASKAIEELSQAPERGHSEKLKEYLAAMVRFHRYSLLCVPQHRNENVNCRTMLIQPNSESGILTRHALEGIA